MKNTFSKTLVLALLIAASVTAGEPSTSSNNNSSSSKWITLGCATAAFATSLAALRIYRERERDRIAKHYFALHKEGVNNNWLKPATNELGPEILSSTGNNEGDKLLNTWKQNFLNQTFEHENIQWVRESCSKNPWYTFATKITTQNTRKIYRNKTDMHAQQDPCKENFFQKSQIIVLPRFQAALGLV